MYRKLLLSGILFFPSTITSDITVVHKSILPTLSFDLTKANHPNKKTTATVTPFWETTKKNDPVDTAALKQSNWYAEAIKNIEASEYEIKKDDKTGMYVGPNRQQQLKAFFNYNSFTLQPQSEKQNWTLKMQLSGIYAGPQDAVHKKLVAQPGENDLPVIGSNKIVFNNDNFSTEYINSKEGVRQNFIIKKEPAGNSGTLTLKLETNKNWYINKVHDKELHFAKPEGDELSKKITYNSLKVWDANNKELDARFVVNKKHTAFEIEVNAADAVYPITIDPVSTTASAQLESNQTNAFMGYSVASAGDVNGDGYSDVIVGVPLYFYPPPFEIGGAFIFHGSSTGISTTIQAQLKCNQTTQSDFGLAVSGAGDVNGDGYSDVIVGARNYTNGQSQEGAAFVFLGSAAGIVTTIQAQLEINQSIAYMGQSVACAGDVNGDGYSDVIVGSPAYDDPEFNEGAAFIYHGSGGGINPAIQIKLELNLSSTAMGVSVASAGDVNGDGYSDVIVGAPNFSNPDGFEGGAFVYHGSATGITNIIRTQLESNQFSASLGVSVASAGDVNGDGYSDVIVGADYYDNGQSDEGAAFVYHGSASGITTTIQAQLEGNQADARFGITVASAGDVNGDGYSDVIVGAFQYDNGQSNEGAAFVYHGSATGIGTTIKTQLECNQIGAEFGNSVASAGDVNGDGYSDVIAGAPNYDNGNTDEGAAFIYHGGPVGLINTGLVILERNQINAEFGFSVASAGDVNGDGYSDVIVGARYFDNGQTDEGAAFVFHGSAAGINTTIQAQLECDVANAFFGTAVAGAGDVNGDGYSDVIVSAPQFSTGDCAAFVYHGSPAGIINTVQTQLTNVFGAWIVNIEIASAGDVNGDGYGDVIIGAFYFENGQSQEGGAFVYHGSPTGITTTIQTQLEVNQAFAHFGTSVAGAGDVNGDGYSDVIVGAFAFANGQTNEGAAFVFHGSSAGVTTTIRTQLEGNISFIHMGSSVASAGDVNGDGFNDVIVGAPGFDNVQFEEGAAFVFHGSTTGITTTIQAQVEGNLDVAQMGNSVGSAGDVNGDGYSDVIVGAFSFSNGQSEEGKFFVYHGGPAGVSTSIQLQIESNQAGAQLGLSVASAGDVNGDGYSDIITGARGFTNGQSGEGVAFVYMGNAGGGLRNNLRLYNTDLTTPIGHFNVTEPNLFGAGLFSKSPLGRVRGRLVWEVKGQGAAFSGNPITNSTAYLDKQTFYTDLGIAGIELKSNVQKAGSRNNKIRTRVEYDKATAITGQVYGPWRYPPGYTQGAHGMNSIPLPVKLTDFNGTLVADKVKLQWSSSDDENVATYQVQRSNNNSNFTAIGSVNAVHQNGSNYNFADIHPLKGISWYRLLITDEYNRLSYSKTIVIKNNNDAAWVYPTVIDKAEPVNLQFKNSVTGSLEIRLINSGGATVFKKTMATTGNTVPVELPALSSGVYILSVIQNGQKIITQKIILR